MTSLIQSIPMAEGFFFEASGALVAILLGFVCSSIFSGKGHSALLGFLVGLFLPIIGLIIALLLPSKH